MKKTLLFGLLLSVLLLVVSCKNNNSGDNTTTETTNTTPTLSTLPPVEYTMHTVTFDSMGGTNIESVEVIEGNPVQKPTDPSKDNFSFTGWYKETETILENAWNFGTDRVNSDVTLYAGWTLKADLTTTASLTYELEDSTYTVTGVGDEVDIIIPETYNDVAVTRIGEAAFARKTIQSIILPDNITEIGLNAFNNCSELVSVYIGPDSKLERIGNNAFSGNSSLESIYLPASCTTLGTSVFNNTGSMEHFVVASGNTVYQAMNSHLVLTSTMTLIRGANQVVIPEGILELGQASFRRSELDSVVIPSTVNKIGNYVFNDASDLKEIVVSGNNTTFSSLDGILYTKDQKALIFAPLGLEGNVELSSNLESIPSNAFDRRTSIQSIYIPNGSLTSIGNFSFRGTTLKILFEGSETAWNNITKGNLWGGAELEIEYNASKVVETSTNILIVYFSWSERTEAVASNIAQKTGADLVEIIAQTPYTTNYTTLLNVARTELSNNTRPEISNETYSKINMDDYSHIFIGYPIWHGSEPMIIRTFIEHYNNLSGKTVFTFDTSASSDGSTAHNNIVSLCSNAGVESNLHLNNNTLPSMDSSVTTWLATLTLPSEDIRVKMSFNTYEIYFTLSDTTPALDLLARLQNGPITLSFSDYVNSEKIAYPSPELNVTNTEGYDPKVGDVTIYAPWGNIAIFYRDTADYSDSLKYVGTIEDDGIAILAAQTGSFDVTLSLA